MKPCLQGKAHYDMGLAWKVWYQQWLSLNFLEDFSLTQAET